MDAATRSIGYGPRMIVCRLRTISLRVVLASRIVNHARAAVAGAQPCARCPARRLAESPNRGLTDVGAASTLGFRNRGVVPERVLQPFPGKLAKPHSL